VLYSWKGRMRIYTQVNCDMHIAYARGSGVLRIRSVVAITSFIVMTAFTAAALATNAVHQSSKHPQACV
jgi:hypothetical protein